MFTLVCAVVAALGLVARHRVLFVRAERRRRSQAHAVAEYIGLLLTPFRVQDHDIAIDSPYWTQCLEIAVRGALRAEELRGGVLRITHTNSHRPDPVLLQAARRAFGPTAGLVSRCLVPIEVWFARHSVKVRFAEHSGDAGTLIWSD